MGVWRSPKSTWKDTPTPPVNTGPTAEDRIKALEERWSTFAKQTREYETKDRQAAGRALVNHDLYQSQRAMMRSGGDSGTYAADNFRQREELFRQVSRPMSFDAQGGLTSVAKSKSGFGNAFKTGW